MKQRFRFHDGSSFGPKDYEVPTPPPYGKLPVHLGGNHEVRDLSDSIKIIVSDHSGISNSLVFAWRRARVQLALGVASVRVGLKSKFSKKAATKPTPVKWVKHDEPWQLG